MESFLIIRKATVPKSLCVLSSFFVEITSLKLLCKGQDFGFLLFGIVILSKYL